MDRHIPHYPIHRQPANHMALQGFQHPPRMGSTRDARAPRPILKDIGERWEVVNVSDAPAHVSTHRGRFPKRHPTSNPVTIIRHDFKVDMKRKAAKLREEYPEIIRFIKKPTTWDDLYYLWDAADIQIEGPDFLYYVLHCIGSENEQLDKESDAERMKEIDSFAAGWIADNRSGLLNVVPGSLYNIFCTDEDISLLTPTERSALQTSLRKYHTLMIRNTSYPSSLPSQPIEPPHSVPQSSYGLGSSAGATPTRASSDHGQQPELASRRSAMPLAVQSQSMSNLKLEHSDVSSVAKSEPPALDHLAESQRTTISTRTSPADISEEPSRKSNNNAPVSQPANRAQPVENLNYRNSWARQHGQNQPTRSGPQQQNSDQRAFSSSILRESPPRNPPQEPIYLHNAHQGVSARGRNETSNTSRISSFNDTGNAQAMVLHENIDFGPMKGDPNLRKSGEHYVYEYGNGQSAVKTPQGRTLFVSGPSWGSFVTHQVKDIFSKCGQVESIRYLLKGQNSHGPMFVTFQNDVLEVAINRFDGYKMPDGYRILAKYPRNDKRDRSSSQSSFTSYNGDGQSDLTRTPKHGYAGQSQSRRPSVSNQHSRSPSGTRGLRYPNESQLPATNGYRHPQHEFQASSHLNSLPYNPGPYSPQVIQGDPFRSMVSEVVQHEIGMHHFQRQVPMALMNSRPNIGNKLRRDEFRSPGTLPPQQCNNSPRSGFTTSRVFNNFKENSPTKRTGSTPASPAKNTNTVQGSKHAQQRSRQNTTVLSAHPGSLVESSDKAEVCVTPKKEPSVVSPPTSTLDLVSSKLDENTAPHSNITDSNVEAGLEKPKSIDTPSLVVRTDHQHNTRTGDNDTRGPETFTPSSQPNNKNTKRQKNNKKSANKIETNRESSSTTTPTTVSPTDTECTNLTSISKDMSIDREASRKPSGVCVPQAEPPSSSENSFSEVNTDTITGPAALTNDASSGNAAEDKKLKSRAVSDKKATSPSTEATAKTGHRRAKTGGSSSKGRSGSVKDDKKQKTQPILNSASNCTSVVDSTRKADAKLAVTKNNCDNIVQKPKDLDQHSRKSKPGSGTVSPGNGQETISPAPGSLEGSNDWPVLAPAKSSQSIIADGKPPQVPSIPALNYRKATDTTAPALPVA